jgi:hypothetical protein
MGFFLFSAVEPSGVITGFCFSAASTAEQPLAQTFFNLQLLYLWLNDQLGRPRLKFADLMGW